MLAKKEPVRARVVRGKSKVPQTLITVGGEVMQRPNPNQIDKLVHEALCGAFMPYQVVRLYRSLMMARRIYTTGAGKRVSSPDYGVRLGALKDYMDRTQGRPIERQMVIKATEPMSAEGLIEQARSSPVFLDTLIGMLQDVKAEANAKP